MASVRLPVPVEHRILRGFCGLPPAAHRLVLGRPIRSEGQTLARDIQAILLLARLSGTHDFYAGMTAAEARAHSRRSAAVADGPRQRPMERVEERSLPGPAGPLPTRFYVPFGQPADAPAPLLVHYHGGGFVIGDLDTADGVCRLLAEASGASVLSVDYRLAPEHPFPAAVEDAWAAFAWAAANAAALGADPARIAVGGDSAGGNLAAAVTLLAREGGGAAPGAQLLIYPVTDTEGTMPSRRTYAEGYILTKADMDAFEAAYLPDGADHADARVSVLHGADPSALPPAYVVTAGFDPLRDEGEAYALRLREAGNRVALRRHPGLIHSFANETAVSPTALAAMLEAAGALRMALVA
ncbi:MAG TPA: alpha/beta hydrolase [Solirubrobacterales bacterium]